MDDENALKEIAKQYAIAEKNKAEAEKHKAEAEKHKRQVADYHHNLIASKIKADAATQELLSLKIQTDTLHRNNAELAQELAAKKEEISLILHAEKADVKLDILDERLSNAILAISDIKDVIAEKLHGPNECKELGVVSSEVLSLYDKVDVQRTDFKIALGCIAATGLFLFGLFHYEDMKEYITAKTKRTEAQ
jgi:hypothetical protein